MSSISDSSRPEIGRRRFIQGAVVLGAGLAADYLPFGGNAQAGVRLHRWSNPRTWGGRVPGRNQVVRISKPVLLDVDARVGGIVIERGGSLVFHPGRSVTLRSRGNVIVNGRLTMVPASPAKKHRLVFVDVKESRYKGGGMKPVASDVGLWVVHGVLNARGSDKLAWTRAAGSISAGAQEIELQQDPLGWRLGDEIVITPTLPPSDAPSDAIHAVAFDRARVADINGRRIKLSRATRFEHPMVEAEPDKAMAAEVLNLTRNVVIQGTARGRAHIKITSHRRQKLKHIDVRYMGPRRKAGKFTEKVLGRWSLHFHHCGHGSHGSSVRGVVVRDSGSHAFVPHKSHGILFKDCIAYNNLETPYWWDEPTDKEHSRTNGIVYDSCVAALINFDPPHRGGTQLMGFKLAQGANNKAVKCVAVGIQGPRGGDSSGFGWVVMLGEIWAMQDCVAHNNNNLGSRFWVNHSAEHVVREFTAYHNGTYGSLNGAYGNNVAYLDSTYHANGRAALCAKATTHEKQRFDGLHVDQADRSDYCLVFNEHVREPSNPILVRNSSFRGHKKAALGFTNDTAIPDLVDVVDCSFEGNEFWLEADIDPRTRIRVQDPTHGAIQLARWDQVLEGVFVPEWNAWVKQIEPFA